MEAMTIDGCGAEMAGDFVSGGFGRSRFAVRREAVAACNGTSVLLSHEGGWGALLRGFSLFGHAVGAAPTDVVGGTVHSKDLAAPR
jgi:hypothetical protein